MAFLSLTYENGALVLSSPYSPALVAALKATIPATERQWDGQRKVWKVAPQHGPAIQGIVQSTLGATLTMPRIASSSVTTETRVLDCRYIGATKDRGDGTRTAFAWVQGQWSVIFAERVLMSWFGAEVDDTPERPAKATTLYGVLGLRPTATPAEIRTAYRRMAMHNHPDVSKEPDAHERFISIKRAYDVLSNEGQRARYDTGLKLAALAESDRKAKGGLFRTALYGLPDVSMGYRSPLRCGLILVEGHEVLGRFIVENILAWEDLVNDKGQTLVTSWMANADTFEERWV